VLAVRCLLRKNKILPVCIFMFVLFLLPSCNSHTMLKRPPKDILSEDKMKPALQDVFLADAYVEEKHYAPDSSKIITNRLYSKIFTKYGIKSAEFYKSMEFYSTHPNLFEEVMVPVVDSLSAVEARTK